MTAVSAVAVALDGVLCDTSALWLDWLEAAGSIVGFDPKELPADRAQAVAELDRQGAGNWRTLLGRWSEERAPVYLRRDAGTSRALRALEAAGWEIGVFTDAPEPLARTALSHLETGFSARKRLLKRLASGAIVVESRAELLALAP